VEWWYRNLAEFTIESELPHLSSEMCLEKMIRYDEGGVDQLLCSPQLGMLPHEKVPRSIVLLGTKVLPELER
jgi:hypothetical protein